MTALLANQAIALASAAVISAFAVLLRAVLRCAVLGCLMPHGAVRRRALALC